MKLNEIYHGFKLVETEFIKEVQSEANVYLHEKSGARLLHLKNDDDNKVFSVAFRTPVSDSTGVPHIVEHCVLSGSRKYKTKEPFMDMVKGSLKTFINAMTFPDMTIYPVASKNEKDFRNLMDVYLDSVFFPSMHEDKEIFMQEGWHYHITDKNEPITYNGVVFNEMRGAYSTPLTQLSEYVGKTLFPDTTYQYSSGGNPDVITDLTLEGFRDFHTKYYQPSNAYIYVYGNGEIMDYLKHIDEDYLTHFVAVDVDSEIKLQETFEKPVSKTYKYNNQNTENETYLSKNYVLGLSTDSKLHIVGDVMKEVLVTSASGPIKKALLDAGIGQDIMCDVDGGLQLYLSITAKNANAKDQEKFESIIEETLQKVVQEGINTKALESAINITEYNLREATGFATKGIVYHINSMNSWLYDGGPTNLIQYDEDLRTVRSFVGTSYFENFIKEYLINNNHVATVTMIPEQGIAEEKAKVVEERLSEYKASLTEAELADLVEENLSLQKKQLSPDSEEAIATIPQLSVSDVNKDVERVETSVEKVDNYTLLHHNIFANDIAYVEMLFNIKDQPIEEVPYIGLLADLIGEVDTTDLDYGSLNHEIYRLTGGISTSTKVLEHQNRDYIPKLVVSGKVVANRVDELLKLMNTLITSSVFENTDRLKTVLMSIKSKTEMSINYRGDNYASLRVASYFSKASNYREQIKGFEYFWFINDLVQNFDERKEQLVEKLTNLYNKLFNKNNMIISFTGTRDDYELFKKHHEVVLENIQDKIREDMNHNITLEKKNEGIGSDSNVQYVATGYNFKELGYGYTGHMQVLRTVLSSEYLHDRIRAKGGAYGYGITFANTGDLVGTTYRDPRLKESLDVFKEASEFVKELSLDQEALTKLIIGAISRSDAALTAKGKGAQSTENFISGKTYEFMQQERDAILNITLADLKAIAPLLDEVMQKEYYCVYGNQNKLNENKELFKEIKSLNT